LKEIEESRLSIVIFSLKDFLLQFGA
jgi:hypothetical protein